MTKNATHIHSTAVCNGMKVNGVFVEGCGTLICWVKLQAGAKLPLETEAIPQPRYGLVAYNSKTGGGKVLTKDDVDSGRAAEWASKWAMTFHRTHFTAKSCPVVKARKAKPNELPIGEVA